MAFSGSRTGPLSETAHRWFRTRQNPSRWVPSDGLSRNALCLRELWACFWVVHSYYLPLAKNVARDVSLAQNLVNTGPRFDVRAFFDFPPGRNLFFACITDEQDFQLENDLSAAQRVISINGDGFSILTGDQETLGFSPFVFHQDGGADFTIFLGNIPDLLGDDERLIPGAKYLIAVQGNFYDFACGPALQLGADLGRQDHVDPVDIPEGKFNRS